MMRADTVNWHDYGNYTETTALSLNVYSTDKDESKRIIMHETLSQNCSVNKKESKRSIVNETLLQNKKLSNGVRQIRIHYYGTKRQRELGYL